MRYFVQTLGCQMNYSDSERLSYMLEKLGFQPALSPNDANLVMMNTCSIRQKAEDKAIGYVRHLVMLKRERPDLLIGLTGCMVRTSSSKNSDLKQQDALLKNVRGLDFVLRIEELSKLPHILQEIQLHSALREIDTGSLQNYFNISPKYTSKFQAYVPIMTGCDNFCTFCIVPYTRGRERSRTMEEIAAEVQTLVAQGCKEITLLGQKVNGYGLSSTDQKNTYFSRIKIHPFAQLLKLLHAIDGLQRIRFTSSHPDTMSDDLIATIAQLEKVCPYIHLPVQSGDDEILLKMNRRYTQHDYFEVIRKFRELMPDVSLSTDVIVGFCGETHEQFMNTYRLFEEVRFDMAYISEYSPRSGTASHRLFQDDVPLKEKSKRFHILNDLLEQISMENHKSWIGKTVNVLVEKCENDTCIGRTEHFRLLHFPGDSSMIGEILPVEVIDSTHWGLLGAY